jgi:riboflavin kinase/FMN adenylyltransferase
VHRGHQAVIDTAKKSAMELGAPLAVLTFDPHPRSFFLQDEPRLQIASLEQKLVRLASFGVDIVFVLRFDSALAQTSPERFVSDVLHAGIAARHVVTGNDYRFGHGRVGDVHLLERLNAIHGLRFTAVAPFRSDEAVYSSSAIRNALGRGAPEEAARMLGAPWALRARIEKKAVRQVYSEEAIIAIGPYLRPADGCYVVGLRDDHGWQSQAVALIEANSDAWESNSVRLTLSEPCPLHCGDIINVDFIRRLPPAEQQCDERRVGPAAAATWRTR